MISELVKEISPFHVMEVLEKAKDLENQGLDIIHFEIGEPDFDTPKNISKTAISSINEGKTNYTGSLGIDELRTVVANYYNSKYGININIGNVIITMGSSPALLMAMLSTINPGDEVLITDPYYACYPQIIRIAGGIPKKVLIYEDDGYQIDIDRLKSSISNKTKSIIINSPSNPTGTLLDTKTMSELADLGIMIISDEIYHGLVYDDTENTILKFTDNAIVVNGFSKLFSMTGWRLGYMIIPPEYLRYIQKLQQNLFISPNSFVQYAGVEALMSAERETRNMVNEFNLRRVEMIKGLKSIGFNIGTEPKGAFYLYVNSSGFSNDSYKLAFNILENCNVAVTPGIDFSDRGNKYLRFSYATSMESIREGIERLGNYLI